jgi:hypothetical protein
MTTQSETTEKQKPAFHIFNIVDKDGEWVGCAFAHMTGNGFNIVLRNGKRYAAFPPKPKGKSA